MAREIKFRAWDNTFKRWVSDFSQDTFVTFTGDLNPVVLRPTATDVAPDEGVFMQYTGLKDKNGVEVYEGDILRVNTGTLDTGGIGRVMWFESGCNFAVTGFRTEPHNHAFPDMHQEGCMHRQLVAWLMTEVIGNIYENPELLESRS